MIEWGNTIIKLTYVFIGGGDDPVLLPHPVNPKSLSLATFFPILRLRTAKDVEI